MTQMGSFDLSDRYTRLTRRRTFLSRSDAVRAGGGVSPVSEEAGQALMRKRQVACRGKRWDAVLMFKGR